MEPTNTRIKKIVLRRAHTIRVLSLMLSRTMAALLVMASSLYMIAQEVWVARVIENMPSLTDVVAIVRFFEVAFMNTTAVVQVLSVMLAVATVGIVSDAFRSMQLGLRYSPR